MPAHNVYYGTMLSLITDGFGNAEAFRRRLSYVSGLPVVPEHRIFAVKVSGSIDRPVIFIRCRGTHYLAATIRGERKNAEDKKTRSSLGTDIIGLREVDSFLDSIHVTFMHYDFIWSFCRKGFLFFFFLIGENDKEKMQE